MSLIFSTATVGTELPAFTILPTCEPEEVIYQNIPVKALAGIIGGYYNFDCKEIVDAKYNASIDDFKCHRSIIVDPNLTWFGQHILAAGLVNHYILYGNAYAMEIIRASAAAAVPKPTAVSATAVVAASNKNTAAKPTSTVDILKVIVRSWDPRNRCVEETALGTALIANSVNPIQDSKTSHGFFEQITGSGLITDQNIAETFNRVLPISNPNKSSKLSDTKAPSDRKKKPYWQMVTDKRMQRFIDANTELGKAIMNDKVPLGRCLKKREASPAVQRYRRKIAIDPNEVIQVGITMDLMIAVSCFQFIEDNYAEFGHLYSSKSRIHLILTYGSMLGLAAVDDAHVIIHGTENVMGKDVKQLPPRELILQDGSPYYSSGPAGLGFTIYLNEQGSGLMRNAAAAGRASRRWFGPLMSNKSSNVAKFMSCGK